MTNETQGIGCYISDCLFVNGPLKGRMIRVPEYQDLVRVVPSQPVDPGAPGELRLTLDDYRLEYEVDRSDPENVMASCCLELSDETISELFS